MFSKLSPKNTGSWSFGTKKKAALKRTVFFHIPKCGGSSVRAALRKAYIKAGARRHKAEFHLDTKASKAASDIMQQTMMLHREHVFFYSFMQNRYPLYTGHFPFSEAAVRAKQDNDVFLTLIRHPIDRLLSAYYYNRYKEKNREHFGIDVSIEEWLESMAGAGSGGSYASFFTGSTQIVLESSDTSQDIARKRTAKAIEHLRSFDVIGDTANMSEFAQKVSEKTGLSVEVEYLRKSPKAGYPKYDDQPQHVKSLLDQVCEQDLRIYEAATRDHPSSA